MSAATIRRFMFCVVLAAGLAACNGSSNDAASTSSTSTSSTTSTTEVATTAGAPAPACAGDTITIKNFSFAPKTLTAKVGDTVTITNDDGTNHTVTALDGSFDTGPFSAGSKTITLTKTGVIPYHCNIHNFMTATIDVTS